MNVWFWTLWLGGMAAITALGTFVIKKYRDTYGYTILVVILASLLTVNTVMAGRKVSIEIFGLSMILLSGTVIWPFTSQIIDMINEVYGSKKSYVAAALAYLGRIIFLMVATAASYMKPLWEAPQEAWWQVYFGSLWRIVVAGAISYGMVQFFNIYVFVKFKRKTMPTEIDFWSKLKGGFLRSWGGDFFGDLLDSPVFYLLAFAGVMPWPQLFTLTLSAWVTKMIINQIDLPFYALFRVLLGDKVQKDY